MGVAAGRLGGWPRCSQRCCRRAVVADSELRRHSGRRSGRRLEVVLSQTTKTAAANSSAARQKRLLMAAPRTRPRSCARLCGVNFDDGKEDVAKTEEFPSVRSHTCTYMHTLTGLATGRGERVQRSVTLS